MSEARRRSGSIRHRRGVFVLLRLQIHQLDFGGGAGGHQKVIYDGLRRAGARKMDLRRALNHEPTPINGGGRSERSSAAKSRRMSGASHHPDGFPGLAALISPSCGGNLVRDVGLPVKYARTAINDPMLCANHGRRTPLQTEERQSCL